MHTDSLAPSHHQQRRCVYAWMAAMALMLSDVSHACWQEAGQRYNVNPYVLQGIAKCESSLNPKAMNRSHVERTGTYDIGLMQINSSNLPGLKAHGIGETELMDACTSIHVGAWILSQKIQRYGNTWDAIGAYNAACSRLKGEACTAARTRYARCVYNNLPIELKDSDRYANESAPHSTSHRSRQGSAASQLVSVRVTP